MSQAELTYDPQAMAAGLVPLLREYAAKVHENRHSRAEDSTPARQGPTWRAAADRKSPPERHHAPTSRTRNSTNCNKPLSGDRPILKASASPLIGCCHRAPTYLARRRSSSSTENLSPSRGSNCPCTLPISSQHYGRHSNGLTWGSSASPLSSTQAGRVQRQSPRPVLAPVGFLHRGVGSRFKSTPDAYDNLTKTPTIIFETVLSRANLRPEQ